TSAHLAAAARTAPMTARAAPVMKPVAVRVAVRATESNGMDVKSMAPFRTRQHARPARVPSPAVVVKPCHFVLARRKQANRPRREAADGYCAGPELLPADAVGTDLEVGRRGSV